MKLGPYELGPNGTPENGIYCGDALQGMAAVPAGSVGLIVTDPPYNVGKDYGKLVNDRLPEAEYLAWYSDVAAECFRVIGNGYLYVSCTTGQLWTLRPIWENAGFSWQLMCIWWGPNYAGNSNTIRQQWRILYEPIMMFLKGKRQPMLNEVRGYKTDAIMRYTRPQRGYSGHQARRHPTQKPLDLYANIIARTPGDVMLDPFVGAGTSAMAAKMLGRCYLAFEIEPATCELARERVRQTQPPLFTVQEEQADLF